MLRLIIFKKVLGGGLLFLTHPVCRVNSGKHNVYRMSAASPEEKEEWMKNIKSVVVHCVLFSSSVICRTQHVLEQFFFASVSTVVHNC